METCVLVTYVKLATGTLQFLCGSRILCQDKVFQSLYLLLSYAFMVSSFPVEPCMEVADRKSVV